MKCLSKSRNSSGVTRVPQWRRLGTKGKGALRAVPSWPINRAHPSPPESGGNDPFLSARCPRTGILGSAAPRTFDRRFPPAPFPELWSSLSTLADFSTREHADSPNIHLPTLVFAPASSNPCLQKIQALLDGVLPRFKNEIRVVRNLEG